MQTLEPGTVVRLRSRLWRVDYVAGDHFGATPLDGRDAHSARFHRRLETVEPGAMPRPDPAALGDEREQRLLLKAQQFSLVHGTAPIIGIQRSRAIPTDYQLVPLLLSLGEQRVRLLIADDVGTGKTIEAGLVLSELFARGAVRRVLVVVPANLREQWREALSHFFHVEATVVAGHLLPALERRLLPGRTVWGSHDLVIASVDYLKTRTEEVLLHPWDLVIIDEAHLCARPHRQPGRAEPDMERWEFARRAAAAAKHLLLLTATPHNGYTDSYASLLGMLAPELVREVGGGAVSIERQAARRHVVQRRRRDIEAWYTSRGGPSPFPQRDADEIIIDLKAHHQLGALFRELAQFTDLLYKGARERPMDGWIASHLQKRALSSPEALRISLRKRIRAVEKRAATEASKAAVAEARAAVADQLELGDAGDEGQVDRLDQAASSLDTDVELSTLRDLLELAGRVTPARDPKLARLLELIPGRLNKHPQARRVMVFTKFTDTLNYVARQLEAVLRTASRGGLPPDLKVFTIDGSLSLAQRREVFAEFERASPAVLVATDCISEGLNLQRACAELIHWELPWNPNRLEQRNGRVDRFHQPEPTVGIRTLVYDDPLDASLLELIVTKSKEMYDEYGFVPPFLANPDILMHLSRVGAARRTSPTLFDTLDQDDLDLGSLLDRQQLDRIRDESFYGQETISLGLVEAALQRSREEVASPQAIRDFVRRSLTELGATLQEVETGVFRFDAVPERLADLVPQPNARFAFDSELGFADPELDVLDLAHPLVRRLVDDARDRARAPACRGRVAGRITPAVAQSCAVAHVLIRYLAQGQPPVLLEELAALTLPIWGATTAETVEAALCGPAGRGNKHSAELREDAAELLARPDLEERLDAFAADRAASLAARHAELDADWARGLDDVRVMSRDLVAVTLVYPEVAR